MFKRWAAFGLVLALCALAPEFAGGQASLSKPNPAGGFGFNYPNPFNPETTIPFTIGLGKCSDATQHVVTIRILNQLTQTVAIPKLQGTKDGGASGQVGRPVENLKLRCGEYEAFFDGKDQRTRREIASGPYHAFLYVDGKWVANLSMLVIK